MGHNRKIELIHIIFSRERFPTWTRFTWPSHKPVIRSFQQHYDPFKKDAAKAPLQYCNRLRLI